MTLTMPWLESELQSLTPQTCSRVKVGPYMFLWTLNRAAELSPGSRQVLVKILPKELVVGVSEAFDCIEGYQLLLGLGLSATAATGDHRLWLWF